MLLLLAACRPVFDATLAAQLQDELENSLEQAGAPGAQQHVWLDGATWTGASGQARKDRPVEMTPTHLFRMASITKMYVGALAAALHTEGELDLDAPAATLVPEAPHGSDYTLRQALHHTSGLPDYVSTFAMLSAMDQPWEPEELLALVEDEPLTSEPGSAYEYANSNYVVAGLAIEAATGRTWQEQVRERFVDPLELETIAFPTEEPVRGELATGYLGNGGNAVLADDVDPSIAWAVGEIVGDSADLATLSRELVTGELLSDEAYAAWTEEGQTPDGPTGYGLGVEVTPERLGHSGSILGFQSRVWVERASGTTVVSAVNSFTSEADVLDEAAWRVLDTAVADR